MAKRNGGGMDPFGDGLSRRSFLGVGLGALAGLTLGRRLAPLAFGQAAVEEAKSAVAAGRPAARAKSVILLWMWGGPSHLDTFDPKPEAGDAYCGPLKKPIETNVAGIRISELLPLMAKQADKYSIIRSMTHGNSGHESATYIMQTCSMPSDLSYPAIGAVVAYEFQTGKRYTGPLPPFITLTSSPGRFSEAGFLGPNYRSFTTGGDPAAKEFNIQGLVLPHDMTDQRVQNRQEMLQAVNTLGVRDKNDPGLSPMSEYQRRAWELMRGEAPQVFNLSTEPEELRKSYGMNRFGQSCLAARRLVEKGVPFVTITSGGWDTHKENFEQMRKLSPVLDAGFATLLSDLAARGLLESTIVVWTGEFGRTPKIDPSPPWGGGRGHYGDCFSVVVAGGGFKGGQVLGSSDGKGEKVKERPVYPWDLSGTMYQLLGIDINGKLPSSLGGMAASVMPPLPPGTKSGGLLKELVA